VRRGESLSKEGDMFDERSQAAAVLGGERRAHGFTPEAAALVLAVVILLALAL
jgi:hypothetical protein